MAEAKWNVVEGTGWIDLPGFGRIAPRRDDVGGGRQHFTAMTLQDEYCRAHGDTLDGGPETFGFQFDQPFLLADADSNTLEIEISLVAGGRYAIRYREGSWPTGSAGAW